MDAFDAMGWTHHEENIVTFVSISALTIPEGADAEVEQRFAARPKGVDSAAGFEGFELLRPQIGESRYFVVTRWDSRENYDKWSAARQAGKHADDERRGMRVEVLGFDVVPLHE